MALQTGQMMVPFGVGIVTSGRSQVAGLMDHPQVHQGLQDPINGGPGKPRKTSGDRLEDLVGGRMVHPARQDLQDDPPLAGYGKSLLATEFLETLEFVLNEGGAGFHRW